MTIRSIRLAAGASQADFAARLGVALESYRPWDTGRRSAPPEVLAHAAALVPVGQEDQPLGLPVLARLIGVSVFRLREAARDGRLVVTYGNRTTYGHPIPQATRAAGAAYKRQFFGKKARWVARPNAPQWLATPPEDFDRQIADFRRRYSLSQTQLAARIGVAGRAVIYQWESRKRRPSPLLWRRIEALTSNNGPPEIGSTTRPSYGGSVDPAVDRPKMFTPDSDR